MSNLSPKKIAAINLLETQKELQNYFFSKAVGLEWFYPLKEKGFFNAKNNPSPKESTDKGFYTIYEWPVLSYLEKVSLECSEQDNRKYAEDLMSIIRNVTRPKDMEKIDNYRTWHIFAKIMTNLPADVIQLEDIELISDWLKSRFSTSLVDGVLSKSLLPKFLASTDPQDWAKAQKLVEVMTQIKQSVGGTTKEPETASEEYWLEQLFKKNSKLLGSKCGKATIEILVSRLKIIFSKENGEGYSYIWRPAIEDSTQNYRHEDTKDTLISALREVLLAYAEANPTEVKIILRGLLSEKPFILKRIVLYVISEHYNEFNDLFWEMIESSFFRTELKHELFNLLKKNFRQFNSTQQDRIFEIISQLTADWKEGIDKKHYDKMLRLEWLTAIYGQEHPKVNQLFEEYSKDVKFIPEHPEFPSYSESGDWVEKSPCHSSQLLTKSISEIVKYLNEFEDSGGWKAPSEEGLAGSLQAAVKQKPDKFDNELSQFLGIKLLYKRAIIDAFRGLWQDHKLFNWQKVLEFCLAILNDANVWRRDSTLTEMRQELHPEWLVSSISYLIEDGTKNDEWAFDEVHLKIAERIILRMLEKEPVASDIKEYDALNSAINRPRGRALIALLNYALRCARLSDKNQGGHEKAWEIIKPAFEGEIAKCKDTNLEFSAIIGQHLPNFYYLSKDWLKENIKRIFPNEYNRNWAAALVGYCYINAVYNDLYILLKEEGIFEGAIESDFLLKEHGKQIVQNIAIGYLRGMEPLEGNESLFVRLLEKWNIENITEIIHFFWMQRGDKEKGGFQEQILDFWGWCYKKVKGKETDNKIILSNLNLLSLFLKDLSGDKKDWVMQAAPHVEIGFHGIYLIRELNRLADLNPQEVADIFLLIPIDSITSHEEETIRSIVEKLCKANLKDKAKEICNKYAENQQYFLRDIYEQI